MKWTKRVLSLVLVFSFLSIGVEIIKPTEAKAALVCCDNMRLDSYEMTEYSKSTCSKHIGKCTIARVYRIRYCTSCYITYSETLVRTIEEHRFV